MYSILPFSYSKNLKIINSKYLFLILPNKTITFKDFYFFFYKKKILFFSKNVFEIVFLKIFLKHIFNFFKGFIKTLSVIGRRIKFYINSNFFFYKMNTSNFSCVKLLFNTFIKVIKKTIKVFFFNLQVCEIIEKIKKLSIPNKYTKKGILFMN